MPVLVTTTRRRLLPAVGQGYAKVVVAPGEPPASRSDLGGDASVLLPGRAKVLLRLLHVTDTHIIDAGSPARSDWVEARARERKWRPLLHMARPHDLLGNFGSVAFGRAIADAGTDAADLVVFTGDNIDNAQRNELDAFHAIGNGGKFSFPYEGPQRSSWALAGSPDPASGAPNPTFGSVWPFWLPDGGPPDRFRADAGFPLVPGLVDASTAPVSVDGVGLPWLSALGNHDVMRQGTTFSTPELESIAVGGWRALGAAAGFDPVDPLDAFLADPAVFSKGYPRHQVAPEPRRAAVTRAEFIRAQMKSAAGGFRSEDSGDYVYDTEHVRVVVLETNHPAGHYQGSVGLAQLAWLDERLREARDRPVVVASHHGSESLTNTHLDPEPTDRRLAPHLEAVLLRYGNVVAWLVGHRHVHRIRPLANPQTDLAGLWEITTSSVIDWPCQIRLVEIVEGSDGSIGVHTETLDHDAGPTPMARLDENALAAWHREIAFNTDRVYGVGGREGEPSDRNAYLARPPAR